MDVQGIVNWMRRESFPGGVIHKWALSQEDLPGGIPFMGGFVELFSEATLPLTVEVLAAQAEFEAASLRNRLLATLAARRYDAQNSGVAIDGNTFDTDSESRNALTSAYVFASLDATYSCNWKTADGVFVTLTSPQVIAVGKGVGAFIQKCFDTEKTLAGNIGQYGSAEAILAAFDKAMAA
ncbi:DUF4376 domain-containing protein [Zavarzinella formosa]|uniref:DUF4376 domain-containing protein n=1 Tax=Zavarzinella formosa TaxID=360055 RepID=UPI0002DA6DF6|nr:DUF4376 domain-containing protein [Zavarzinella formosa]